MCSLLMPETQFHSAALLRHSPFRRTLSQIALLLPSQLIVALIQQ